MAVNPDKADDLLTSGLLTMTTCQHADSGLPTGVADPDGDIAAIYKIIARNVAVKIADKAKDFSAKFPTISISKTT